MAHGIVSVSKWKPCPICGYTDWCGFMPSSTYLNGELVLCMRDARKCNQDGHDGKRYFYLTDSKKGNSIYEEYQLHQARIMVYEKGKSKFEPTNKQLTSVGIIDPAVPEKCQQIYGYMQDVLKLNQPHREYLYSQGWDDNLIERHRIVSFPEEDFLWQKYRNRTKSRNMTRRQLAEIITKTFGPDALIGIPGAYLMNGGWTFASYSGIMFPMYTFDNVLFRLRIRRDFMDVSKPVYMNAADPYYYDNNCQYFICMKGIYTLDKAGNRCYIKKGGKYRTLSSFYQDKEAAKQGFFINKMEKGCQSLNEASLYSAPGDDMNVWFFTEGEPKGAYTNEKLASPVVTIPGVNSYAIVLRPENVAKMRARGMKMAVIIFDADKIHNEKVLDSEKALVAGFKEMGIAVAIGEWDENIGKGSDDLLAAGGSIRFRVV